MTEPWILVTNDDGVDSPALAPLLGHLAEVACVRCLVPSREYSWSSKTLSRFARLTLKPVQRGGQAIWTMDGSPADCANVGVYSLGDSRPSLVVSGINIGANAGLSFLLSSGTVGAAVEASLGGVPAAAFSVQMRPEDYERWRRHRDLADLEGMWLGAAAVTAEIVAEILAGGLPAEASLLSVNMPPDVALTTPRRFTGVTETCYGPFFARREGGFLEHEYAGLRTVVPHANGDIEALERGEVALTPLRFALDAAPSGADQARFERLAPPPGRRPS
ncbi:MAG: 5'/3'-nucleotidase SurE [Gemmatimonadota bacterium]